MKLKKHTEVIQDSSIPKEVGSNAEVRRELSVACRALARYGIGDIDRTFNHVCAVAKSKDGEGKVMLLVPFGLPWPDVTPESMLEVGMTLEDDDHLKLDDASITDIAIAQAMVKARPDATALFHCHPVNAVSLGSCHNKDGAIKCSNVSSMFIIRDVAYYTNTGKQNLDRYGSELDRWFKTLGQKHVLMLENHGVTTIGQSVAQAFDKMVNVEQACELQIKSLSCGRKLRLLSEERIDRFIKLMNESYKGHAQLHLNSFRYLLPDKYW